MTEDRLPKHAEGGGIRSELGADADRLLEWADEADDILRLLASRGEPIGFSLPEAIETCYNSLWNIVLLDEAIRTHPRVPALSEYAEKVRSVLPFKEEELHVLAARMRPFIHEDYPQDGVHWDSARQTEDILAIDRWRRWLALAFGGETPNNDGEALVDAISTIEELLAS